MVVGAISDVEVNKAELEKLNATYADLMTQLVAAGNSSDTASMLSLGKQMATVAVAQEKLTKEINKAESDSGAGLVERIKTRDKAFESLMTLNSPDSEIGADIRAMCVATPGVRQIKLEIAGGNVTEVSLIGGFRKVATNRTGVKRPRAQWTNSSLNAPVTTKEAIVLFGQKYGQVTAYALMTPSERGALIAKISKGEGLINKNAVVEPVSAK